MWIQMQICSVFRYFLVNFGKVLPSSANEIQQNANLEKIIFHKY